jgi:class 3 adenylate cyclase
MGHISITATNEQKNAPKSLSGITILDTTKLKHDVYLKENWRYHPGDDPKYAEPGYNDSGWLLAHPYYLTEYKNINKNLPFSGIGWFRLHFYVDSAAVNYGTIGIALTQVAASEIFLDGKKIESFGTINGKDSTVTLNPTNIPTSLPNMAAGEHVLAVRYANYEWYTADDYDETAGFEMTIGYMNNLTWDIVNRTVLLSVPMLTLLGVFIALSLIHLCLYFFNRKEKTNLFFSVFTIATSLMIYCGYFTYIDTSIKRIMIYQEGAMISIALMAFSLSGFSNQLFSKKKLRFRIIAIFSLLCLILWFWAREISYPFFMALFVAVLLEIVFLSIRGMIRKVKGAKIIGGGISFFAVFILFSLVLLAMGKLSFKMSNLDGQIYLISGALSILLIPVSISIYLAWSFAHTSKNLAVQLQQVQTLSQKTLEQEQEKKRILENKQEELEQEVAVRTAEVRQQKEEIENQHTALKAEKKKSDDLLLNILPEEIAEELKNKGTSEAKYFDHVSVLFTDFVDFTKAGERMTPQELVDELHTCFKAFDEICAKYNIEKIKTIGDAYLAVCGLPIAQPDHALNVTKAAIEIRQFIAARRQQMPEKSFNIRIGIHSGAVVAGIVGVKKFAYDIWGDTVNTGARMEQNSEPGKINISESTYQLVKDKFNCTFRGQISAKNKGELNMYFVEGEK